MSIYPTNELQRFDAKPVLLAQRTLTTSPLIIYQSRGRTRIDRIVIAALTNNVDSFTLYHKRDTHALSASPQLSEALAYLSSLAAREMKLIDGPFYLDQSDAIWGASGSANHSTISIYGSDAT